jgi:hypothetical protein
MTDPDRVHAGDDSEPIVIICAVGRGRIPNGARLPPFS